jgi:hypothetical protein
MKYLVVIALVGSLMACSGRSETINAAESAFSQLTDARKMLASVNSVEDAHAIEQDLEKAGNMYAEAIQLMRSSGTTDPDTAKELAKIAPMMAAEYQGMLIELNALQARNIDASQILLDELKSFSKR